MERVKGKERARGLAKDRREQEGEIQDVKGKEKGVSRNKDGGTTGGL